MNCAFSIKCWLRVFLAFGCVAAVCAQAEEVVWDRVPIRIDLVVGVESRIDFPADVRVGVQPELVDKETLRQESLNGSVYFTAGKPFKSSRVYATLVKTNKMVLLDVSARVRQKTESAEPRAPLKVLVAESQAEDVSTSAPSSGESSEKEAVTDQDSERKKSDSVSITPITLTRYAAQQLYAPARLIPQNQNIQRVPMRAPKILAQLYAGGEVRPEPIACWTGGGLYVTAVKVSNLTKTSVDLDPRKLRGRLIHAAFQDKSLRLGPIGSDTDTTTIYLITDRPFVDAVTLKG